MRKTWPAPERNKGPILAELERLLPPGALVLEIASGTGQHVAHFAAALPGTTWQPSDVDPENVASIDAWREGLPGVRPPLRFDVLADPWPDLEPDVVLASNLVHIAPWEVTEALVRGAGRALRPGGLLVLYGPYKVAGAHTAPSNAAFDEDLRARDPRWGVRDLEAVLALAEASGLDHVETVRMPANNLLVALRKR